MYHLCCISINNSSSPLTVITLFDTGANPTSFVNGQVAAWIESQQSQRTPGKRKHSSAPTVLVALAGSSHTCPIYGSVVFQLTFFNEVTRSHLPLACECHRQLHRYHCRPPCDSVALTGTTFTGLVRTQYVLCRQCFWSTCHSLSGV